MLRELIATELETCQIQHRNFESIASDNQSISQRRPMADVTNMHNNRVQERLSPSNSKVAKSEIMQDAKGHSDTKEEPIEWDYLHPALQALLPAEEGLTYVITEFIPLPTEDFHGAPENAFQATVRVNVSEKEAAQSWMEKMMQHSKCTYRHSRGRSPGLKRVLYKAEMHCQHQQKKLTPKQQQKASEVKSKNSRKVLTHDTRMKKTDCPSKLTVTVLVPSKRDRLVSEKNHIWYPTLWYFV